MKAFALTGRDTQPAPLDVPVPVPDAGEVLIEVETASVNGFDLGVVAGYLFEMVPHEFPAVLGRDFVGTVTAVGPGVDTLQVGDHVAGVIPGVDLGPRSGSFADHVAVPVTAVSTLPAGVGVEDAAVVGLAGIAAQDALEALDVHAGDIVLISGATGGVGSIALQLARAAGATVIATARPGREEEYVRSLGASQVIDYTGDLAAAVREQVPGGVDKALHAAGDVAALGQVLRPGGTLATTLGATPEQVGRDDITVAGVMATPTSDKLSLLLDRVARGDLEVNVEARVPLDRVPEALDLFAQGTLGKVLITR